MKMTLQSLVPRFLSASAVLALSIVGFANGQDEPKEQQDEGRFDFPFEIKRGDVLLDDIRVEGVPTFREFGPGGGFKSISVSETNGVRTVTVNDNGQEYLIEKSDEKVAVTYVKQYGSDQMDELKKEHPDLHMHVEAFPKQSGDAEVSLTIQLKTKVEAANPEELEAQYPEAFEIYSKYIEGGAMRGFRMRGAPMRIDFGDGGIFEGMEMPELPRGRFEFRPMRIEARPDAPGEAAPPKEKPKTGRVIRT